MNTLEVYEDFQGFELLVDLNYLFTANDLIPFETSITNVRSCQWRVLDERQRGRRDT